MVNKKLHIITKIMSKSRVDGSVREIGSHEASGERERERVVCNGRGCAMVVCCMMGVGGLWERLTHRERERERERLGHNGYCLGTYVVVARVVVWWSPKWLCELWLGQRLLWWAFFGWIGLDCLLQYWAQIFWVRELRPVQLQLNLVWLVCKLCIVCQEHTYDGQNCFRWVVADIYDNYKIKWSTLTSLLR